MSLVARVWWCCCGVLCCLGGWWGPLVDVDDTPGDFDAAGVMVCGVVELEGAKYEGTWGY